MNKKGKVLLSSCMAIAFCVSLATGATYALFTSESQMNVAIQSGKVNVVATARNLKAYSGEYDLNAMDYVDAERTDAYSGTDGNGFYFANTGYAAMSDTDNSIVLSRITPTDKVSFEIVIHNESNVSVKYRTVVSVIDDDGLFDALNVSINDSPLVHGKNSVKSNWAPYTATQDTVVAVTIGLPENAGNAYQDKSCRLSYAVEAVQGNAYTFDGDAYLISGTTTTEYESLADAANAAVSGDTIKLANDVENAGSVLMKAGVTLNGDGNTVSGNSTVHVDNGGRIENVNFVNIRKDGGKLSPVYASNTAGEIVIANCSFDGAQWDAVQITPVAGANITVTGCTFENTYNLAQQRFVHIQSTGIVDFTVTMTGNTFKDGETLQQDCVEIYYPANIENVNVSGNTIDENFRAEIFTDTTYTQQAYKMIPFAGTYAPTVCLNHATYTAFFFNTVEDALAVATAGDVIYYGTEVYSFFKKGIFSKASEPNVYYVYNKEGMIEFDKSVNDEGNTFAGKTVKLSDDIDLSGTDWTPVGNVLAYPSVCFAGVFDGQNHVINGLTATDTTANYATAGLFGSITGTVKNVKLTNVNITSSHYAGGIVGYASSPDARIENCTVDGGTITSACELIGEEYDNGDKVGGIMGFNGQGGYIVGCTVKNVTIKGYRDIGGIVGWSGGTNVTENTVKDCTIVNDRTHDYKAYATDEEYDVHEIVGEGASDPSNSTENVETVVVD